VFEAELAKERGLWLPRKIFGASTKIRLLKTFAWPVMMYGCKSWTIKKEDESRI